MICPLVWPGVSITCAVAPPNCTWLPFPHRLIQLRQSVRVRRGTHHLGPEPRPHLIRARHVVGMMVGEQNEVEPAAGPLQRRDHRTRLGRIDDGDRPAAAVA